MTARYPTPVPGAGTIVGLGSGAIGPNNFATTKYTGVPKTYPGANFTTPLGTPVGSIIGASSGPSSLNSTPPGMPNTATGTSISGTDILILVAIIGIVVFFWWRNKGK